MADVSWPDRAAIVAAARKNDQAAYKALFDPLWQLAYRRATAILRDNHLAENVAQECCLKLFLHLPNLHLDNLEGWANRVATNLAISVLRKRPPGRMVTIDDEQRVVDLPDDRPNPADLAAAGERGRKLRECLKTLSTNERAAVVLSKLEGLSLDEIASILSSNVQTVGVWGFRGRRKLRVCLEQSA